MTDFETFDAGRVEDIAAKGEWVLVLLLDESDTSREWEEMLEDATVSKCLESYECFLLQLESAPREASEAMERWEVDQLPAMLVVSFDGGVLNETCLTSDSVDEPEDIIQYLDDQVSFLRGDDEE